MPEIETHVVRIHANPFAGGTRWWAEDDLGFTGGADRMEDLVAKIREYAADEGFADLLAMRLVPAEPASSTDVSVRYDKDASQPHSASDVDPIQTNVFVPV